MPAEPSPPRDEKLVQFIIFRLADEEFGVPIGEVREIIRAAPVTPVPSAPAFIHGMINVRGEVAVVVDLKARFALRSPEAPPKHVIITAQGKNLFAFAVDEVTEVLRIARDEVKPPPAISTKIEESLLTGFVVRGGRLIVLLDLPRVLSEEALVSLTREPRPAVK